MNLCLISPRIEGDSFPLPREGCNTGNILGCFVLLLVTHYTPARAVSVRKVY